MLAHLIAQLLYAGVAAALIGFTMGSTLPWWAFGAVLIVATFVDTLWHSWNHKKWVTESLQFSVWIGMMSAVQLYFFAVQSHWYGLLMLYIGQVMWDLSWHSYYHHKTLWTNNDMVRIAAMCVIVLGLGLSSG